MTSLLLYLYRQATLPLPSAIPLRWAEPSTQGGRPSARCLVSVFEILTQRESSILAQQMQYMTENLTEKSLSFSLDSGGWDWILLPQVISRKEPASICLQHTGEVDRVETESKCLNRLRLPKHLWYQNTGDVVGRGGSLRQPKCIFSQIQRLEVRD